jgi:DNA-binding SARP family transcriptional activator
VTLSPGSQRLVALVAVRGRMRRDQVASTLWPDTDPQSAQHRMRSELWRIQRRAPDLLTVGCDTVRLGGDVGVDAQRLDRQARRVLRAMTDHGTRHDTGTPTADAQEAVAELLAWPTGRALLAGWEHDWLIVDRERLHQLHLHALEAAATWLLRQARHGEALDVALRAQAIEPLRESAHAIALTVHVALHNIAEARRHYAAFARLLRNELGVAPSPKLQSLVQGVITRDRADARQ